jgi:hypothetical protein
MDEIAASLGDSLLAMTVWLLFSVEFRRKMLAAPRSRSNCLSMPAFWPK